ncbi:MAG TPA: TspO/MBR family protein [Microlunatus sp.]|nr:TspO/MBR family protein [Microlunatus sp.]
MLRNILPFTAGAVAACAALGSIASRTVDSPWYRSLDKPAIQPPGAVFPVVWTSLYTDIAVTSAIALDRLEERDPEAASAYRRALAINLVLNAKWSWIFFRFHRLGLAAVFAGVLAGSSIDLVRRTYGAEPKAGLALSPYAAWCSFATVLSTAIWRRNRRRT